MKSVRKVYQYSEPNLTVIGWMGILGYPLYYYVWAHLFPQPYESLSLRLFCSLLFTVVAFRHFVPVYLQRYLPTYFSICIPICLPFFFSYMMFKNNWSEIWVMSFMASILIHVLVVFRPWLLFWQTTIAFLASIILVYGANWPMIQHGIIWPYMAIFVFTYVCGNLFYLRSQSENESRVSLAKSFGAGIAHEMRNPLSSLKTSLELLEDLLPAPQTALVGKQEIDANSLVQAHDVINKANATIHNGTETIDLLLTSIDENRITNATYRKYSMRDVVEQTIASFPYPYPTDRKAIQIDLKEDFSFLGSDTLVKYTLYNLLKNAFLHGRKDDFSVSITLQRYNGFNQLILTDNGVGMSSEVSKQIFDDFYTQGQASGYGIGLPFCLRVMRAMGGNIRCRSELGQFTEFILAFPTYKSKVVNRIKHDMLKHKRTLLISLSNQLVNVLEDSAFYLGFHVKNMSIVSALMKKEVEFDFDIIFIDLDKELLEPELVAKLETKLSYTSAKIVYLYDGEFNYSYNLASKSEFTAVEKSRFKAHCSNIIDDLCFDQPETTHRFQLKHNDYRGRTLLIADDNHSIRAYTSILMQKHGFKVLEAHNGQEALDVLKQNLVDLVLMDIEMPILNGLAAARQIRVDYASPKPIPIIGYTGDSSAEMAEKIHESGINDYLIKPADSKALMHKVSEWL